MKSEWARKPKNSRMEPKAVEAIGRRRRQLMVHAYIYYQLNDSLISDATWDRWAQQLVRLQKHFGWKVNFYDSVFRDFDASTGYHLPKDSGVANVATRLLIWREEREGVLQTKKGNNDARKHSSPAKPATPNKARGTRQEKANRRRV